MPGSSTRSLFVVQNSLLSARLSKKVGTRLSIHGISLNEFLVMDYLSGHSDRGVPRLELAEHVGLSASGVTRLVAPMEKSHLVRKESSSRDARQSLIALTETGQRVHREARDSFEDTAGEITRIVSESELSRTISVFEKLL